MNMREAPDLKARVRSYHLKIPRNLKKSEWKQVYKHC